MTTGPRVSKSSADRMDSSQQAGGHSSAPSSPTPSGSDAGTWHLRNIPCPRPGCGRLYSSNSSLRNHLRRKHKGILSLDTSSSAAAPTPASLSQVIGPPIVSPQEPQKYQIYPLPRNPQQHPPLAEARSMPATRRFSGDMQPMAHSQQESPNRRWTHPPYSTSASAGDLRYVSQLRTHKSDGPTTPRGRSFERRSHSSASDRSSISRSNSEPGRRWPSEDAYHSENMRDNWESMDEEQALHRSAAALAAMFPPAHHVHHQHWSLAHPPSTGMCNVDTVPEEPEFARNNMNRQRGAPAPAAAASQGQPLTYAPSGSQHYQPRAPGSAAESWARNSDPGPQFPQQAHTRDHSGDYYYASGGRSNDAHQGVSPRRRDMSVSPSRPGPPQGPANVYSGTSMTVTYHDAARPPAYSHQSPRGEGQAPIPFHLRPASASAAMGTGHAPSCEAVASLDESLKNTHLSNSAKKFSIQHLLNISV